MGLISFSSIIFFIFTLILMFSQRKTGKLFMLFGVLTFALVLSFGYAPQLNGFLQSVDIFVIFSCLFLLSGLMYGIILLLFFRFPLKISLILSSILLLVTMFFLLNVKGLLTYMYIPVLMAFVFKRLAAYQVKLTHIAAKPMPYRRPFHSRN